MMEMTVEESAVEEYLGKIAESLDQIAKYIEDRDTVEKARLIRWQNQVKRAKTRRVKYVDQCSPESARGVLEEFVAYYAGYVITDNHNAKVDEILEAIDKYMEYVDLREATK